MTFHVKVGEGRGGRDIRGYWTSVSSGERVNDKAAASHWMGAKLFVCSCV